MSGASNSIFFSFWTTVWLSSPPPPAPPSSSAFHKVSLLHMHLFLALAKELTVCSQVGTVCACTGMCICDTCLGML